MSPERKLSNSSFPLRMTPAMRQQVEHLADHEGVSINQFISLAVAEKVMRMEGNNSLREMAASLTAADSISGGEEETARRLVVADRLKKQRQPR